MGVQGTPAIFLNDGRQVGGYVPADQLVGQMGIQ
jgi:protein-disulfide isomerase